MIGENYKMKPVNREIKNEHPWIKSWAFQSKGVADLAELLAIECEKNGIEKNEYRYILLSTLRLVKSNDWWAE